MKRIIKIMLVCFFIICLIPIGINFWIVNKYGNNIYNIDSINEKYDYILILGCSVHRDGTPSLMLKDRLDKGIELYNKGLSKQIVVSGDHDIDYSEVEVMFNYLVKNGISESDIIKDERGYNTSNSIKNFANKYQEKSVIVVSQKYHLYRALLLADKYNVKAIGVHANLINYGFQTFREIREILARCKDFIIF